MNARQRFHASLTFAPVDRPFRWETLGMWPETLERWYSEGLDPSLRRPFKDDWGCMASDEFERVLVRGFQFDRVDYLRDIVSTGYTDIPFCPSFEREILKSTGNTQIVRTKEGIIQKEFVHFGTSSMPQFIQFPVRTPQDFHNLLFRLDPDHPDRFSDDWLVHVGFYSNRDFPVGLTICGAFGHPRNLMGVESLCTTYLEQPGFIHEIMEHWLDFYTRLSTKVYQDIQFDFVLFWEDMAYKSGSIISPRLVKDFMLPYYRKVIDHIRSLGCEVIIVDSDGDVLELIPLFLSVGVNTMLPFEVQSGMDVIEIRKKYGKDLAIIGGLDKRLLVEDGLPIKQEIRKMVSLVEQGGYIPSLDHTAPPDISLTHFQQYVKCCRTTLHSER